MDADWGSSSDDEETAAKKVVARQIETEKVPIWKGCWCRFGEHLGNRGLDWEPGCRMVSSAHASRALSPALAVAKRVPDNVQEGGCGREE